MTAKICFVFADRALGCASWSDGAIGACKRAHGSRVRRVSMRAHCGLLSPLVVLFAVPACSRNAKSVKLYEAGDFAAAARAADDGLAEHPSDRGLWQMRVRSALALGDGDGVAKAYATYRDK